MIPRTPYVLSQAPFRFRALAASADRLSLGGDREVALATFVAARLVADVSASRWPQDAQTERAAGARHWFMTQAIPAAARGPFLQLVEAIQRADTLSLAAAWDKVVALASRVVDAGARAELRAVALRPPPREGSDGRAGAT
ncbi:MAG: hypothetical protein ACT4OZ_14905 [Gemmatimonadota bacterium]